jgi:hypothetical protein
MREEKILLMASESGDPKSIYQALDDVIRECTYGKVSCATHSMLDVQYLFLNIRGKSVGEIMELSIICGECDSNTPLSLNITDLEIVNNDNNIKEIQMDGDIVVTMDHPKILDIQELSGEESTTEDVFRVIARCISSIKTPEESITRENGDLEDFLNFLDNVTPKEFQKFEKFFTSLHHIQRHMNYKCVKCGIDSQVFIGDLVNFFA